MMSARFRSLKDSTLLHHGHRSISSYKDRVKLQNGRMELRNGKVNGDIND